MITYRLPRQAAGSFLWSVLALQPRSFVHDARMAVAGLHPELEVLGGEHVPAQGPCLVACNHYSRPGFSSWWLVLAITAAVAARRASTADPQIHWVIAGAWTYPDSPWKRRILTPATRWAFSRVARVYGFVTMPPMPPAAAEVEARALAVLRTVRLARRLAQAGGMLGLAPEGRDVPVGLDEPPEGAGEFITLLVKAGLPVLPVGIAEPEGRLCVSFGPLFVPEIPPDRAERDRTVVRQVMAAIESALHRRR